MTRLALLVAMIAVPALSVPAAAQSSSSMYTKTQLSNFKRRNSASGFSPAQIRSDLYRRTVPQYSFSSQNRNLFGSSLGGGQKPFSQLGARGGVSPYLGLSAPFSSTAEQYYTQVRPQLQQQRINQQMQQRSAQLQHQLNSIAAQPPYDPQGSETVAPTGHGAVFQNRGGYYPEAPPKR